MTTRIIRRAVIVCAAMSSIGLAGRVDAQTRNCPTVGSQVIRADSGQSAIFRLNATNAESSAITIFQYPLGGILQQVGPTALDYAFVPGPDFNGTTDFTYRLTPPFGCGDGALLGRVTIVGAPATSTAEGLNVDPETGISPVPQEGLDPLTTLALLSLINSGSGLCGVGGFPFFLFAGATLVSMQSRRWRR
ncbi:MAG: hypothetical protein HZA51_08140 [Planctomycetes bacterium]|nr:hypothetical protein [Planctomycetota bacterium]